MIKLRINLEKHGESVRLVSVKQYKLLHVCSIYCMLFMKKKTILISIKNCQRYNCEKVFWCSVGMK